MHAYARYGIALAIAFVGGALAIRAIKGPQRHTHNAQRNEAAQPNGVGEADAVRLDMEVTDDNAGEAASAIIDRVRTMSVSALPDGVVAPGRRLDFIDATEARIASMMTGDFERYRQDMLHRGDTSRAEVAQEKIDRWIGQAKSSRPIKLGLEQVRVRTIYRTGQSVADRIPGFGGTTTMTPSDDRRWQPEDPAKANLDIVEVLYPAEIVLALNEGTTTVWMGWQFMWDETTSRWTPWANTIYGGSGPKFPPPF